MRQHERQFTWCRSAVMLLSFICFQILALLLRRWWYVTLWRIDACFRSMSLRCLFFSFFFMFFQRASRDGKLFLCFVPVSILKNNFGGFSRSPFTSAAGRDEDRGRENCAILVRIYFQSRLRHATTWKAIYIVSKLIMPCLSSDNRQSQISWVVENTGDHDRQSYGFEACHDIVWLFNFRGLSARSVLREADRSICFPVFFLWHLQIAFQQLRQKKKRWNTGKLPHVSSRVA